MSQKRYRDLLPVIIERENAVLPEGFDSWGLKSVNADMTTTHDFKWAQPGGRSRSYNAVVATNKSACPTWPGDGLCVATTWGGMASGGISAGTLLLVAYRSGSVLGADLAAGKLRVAGEVAVVAVVDGWKLLREAGAGADLLGADLTGAELIGADLTDAELTGAELRRADLTGAKLYCADLSVADLRSAKLCYADLRSADLYGVNLRRADLTGADLTGANLYCAVNVPLPGGWKLNEYGVAVRSTHST